jgi:signal transduction histidine kinase
MNIPPNQIEIFFNDAFLNRRQKIFIVFILIFFVTLLHYLTASDYGFRHVFFRELYFLPILLAALWLGLFGGLATSLLISLVYGPYILLYAPGPGIHNLGNILELILFNFVGFLVGWMRDKEIAQQYKLRKVESLAAIGRAVSMIAHDLKSPLVSIGGLSRQLSEKIDADSVQGNKIEVIRQQTAMLENMVLNMLDFAKPLVISWKQCDLNQILEQAHEVVYETALKHNVQVEVQKAEKTCFKLDEGKILQVLINLLTNAIEASPNGERVKVSLQTHKAVLSIEIFDKGKGVEDNIAEKIFEPFVSNKRKGTGLGLSISKKIIEAHAGKLEYRSTNSGTTFRVSIPIES